MEANSSYNYSWSYRLELNIYNYSRLDRSGGETSDKFPYCKADPLQI